MFIVVDNKRYVMPVTNLIEFLFYFIIDKWSAETICNVCKICK